MAGKVTLTEKADIEVVAHEGEDEIMTGGSIIFARGPAAPRR